MHAMKMALAANINDKGSPRKIQQHNILIDFGDPEIGDNSA